jgi:hypothetical protein
MTKTKKRNWKGFRLDHWNLEIGIYLGFGAWSLVLFFLTPYALDLTPSLFIFCPYALHLGPYTEFHERPVPVV